MSTNGDKELYEGQIKIVDKQIDWLVYDMYELTEEIKIIESMSYVMPTYATMTAPTTLWHYALCLCEYAFVATSAWR